MTRGRVVRGLAASSLAASVTLLLSSGSAAAGGPAAPTRDPVGAGGLAVQIETVAPAVPSAQDQLTVRGTVTNTSAQPVTGIATVLRVSPTPLTGRGEIPEVLAGAGQRTGQPIPGTRTELTERLAPGASVPFTVRAPVAALGLGSPGAYVTGVEALGSTGAGVIRQDIDRTFLPWWPPDNPLPPLLLTTLWPLAAPPLQDAAGVLLSEEPAVEMSPAGRLDTLVAAAASHPGAVSLVVDPQAVEIASDMADGYEVRTAAGTSPGRRSSEVARWLDALRDAVADPGADAAGMLYGQPDLVAARRGRVLTATLRQRPATDRATEEVLGTPLPSTIALVPGGMLDAPTAARLADDSLVAVLADRALPLAVGTYFTPSGSVALATADGALPTLLVDSGLAATLAMPLGSPAQRTSAQQRLLAETLTTVTELPETQRLLVAAPDPAWSPSADGARMIAGTLADTPWIEPTSLGAALAREPSTLARAPLQYGQAEQDAELPSDQVDQVRAQFTGLAEYGAILADPADLPTTSRTAPSRGLAGWLRGHPEQASDLVERVSAQVGFALGSVRTISSGSITVSGSSGTIPVTVENVGPVPVTVGLTITSDPPQLFLAEPIEPFRIDPGTRTSVEVTAQVAAAGLIPVAVQLITPQGQPFGAPGQLTVRSAAYADAARILVRVALVALALAVLVHGVRRARRRRGARDAPEGTPARQTEAVGG